MAEAYCGSCGGHFGGKSLVNELLRMGYYWQMMEQYSFMFVKKFPQYQQHSNLIHAPTRELGNQVSPWPFSIWGFDLIGKISPPSSQGHTYILTTTDYFTKWVEAVPLCSTIVDIICDFILNNIMT